jgi:photosystem II stability/assembly factor-like uncharacterized protein
MLSGRQKKLRGETNAATRIASLPKDQIRPDALCLGSRMGLLPSRRRLVALGSLALAIVSSSASLTLATEGVTRSPRVAQRGVDKRSLSLLRKAQVRRRKHPRPFVLPSARPPSVPGAFSPAEVAVGVPGAYVSVTLSLSGEELSGGTIDIQYDPTVVTSSGVSLPLVHGCSEASNIPVAGTLRIAVACVISFHPALVFVLGFNGISEGTTALHVDRCDLTDANMSKMGCMVQDGTIAVGSGPLPTGPASVRALTLDPAQPGVLYAGTDGTGVVKSTDGGATWTVKSAGLMQMNALSLAIDPVAPSTIYVGTDNGGVFRSTDGGASWGSRGLDNKLVGALALDPADPQVVYAGLLGFGVFKSTDAGADWQTMNDGLDNPAVLALALDPSASGTLYAGTESGVFKSTDGAIRWTAMNLGLPPNAVVWSVATGASVLYAGTSEGIFRSTDGAASWTAVSSGELSTQIMVVTVDPVQSDTVYEGTASGASRSTDAGQTWSVMNDLDGLVVRTLSIDPATPTTVYAGTDSQLLTSTDSGATWVSTRQ